MIKCIMEEIRVHGSTLGVPICYTVRTGPKGCTLAYQLSKRGRTRPVDLSCSVEFLGIRHVTRSGLGWTIRALGPFWILGLLGIGL